MISARIWPGLLVGCLLCGPLGSSLPAAAQVKKQIMPVAKHKFSPVISPSRINPPTKKPKLTGPPPVISCDKPEFDFGKAVQGDSVKHVYTLKNKGKGVLKIERARGG